MTTSDRYGQEQVPVARRPGRPRKIPPPPPPPRGWQGNDPPPDPPGAHEVEEGVQADLEALGKLPPGRGALKAMALKLARTIDARGDDEAASALAKAVDTLRQVMNQLMMREVTDPDALRSLDSVLGTPDAGSPAVSPAFRYPPVIGPADGRPGNRQGRSRARPD